MSDVTARPVRIEGYAIVSADGMLADHMPTRASLLRRSIALD